jgi:ESCRT-I complex subunit VPS37
LTVIPQRFTQQFLMLRLRHATTAQDEGSERVASEFVKGSSDGLANGKEVDDFVKDFREMRRVYHKRAIFVERGAKGDVGWRDD